MAAAGGASSSLLHVSHEAVSLRRRHDGGVARGDQKNDGCSLADEFSVFKREVD